VKQKIMTNSFDLVIVGGGHAGIEASIAASKLGIKTALITMDKNSIGRMSCNPAIGGLAKGHLVREIDALGGIMGHFADISGIQFKMLNRSKGKAVWSPRAQIDKKIYEKHIQNYVQKQENIAIIQSEAKKLLIKNNSVKGLVLDKKRKVLCSSVIITCGTFLNGLIHIGERQIKAGRMGEESSDGLTESLISLGFVSGRLKTGTPPRLIKRTINWKKLDEFYGDPKPRPFSFHSKNFNPPNTACHFATTNLKTKEIINSNLDHSPMFSGQIKGVGPRYCPSIEDKVFRFSDKDSHLLFLEPEWIDSDQIYTNGFSTSLPEKIQINALRSVRGLENVEFYRPGYAIEYDFFLPSQLKSSLESKNISGLFMAGQINGTSGYEEAAAQGLIAGINASQFINKKDPLVLSRDESYIGVLIDDLVTKDTFEPYRMFTSRAEYRLLIRHTNADIRLSKYGFNLGLIDQKRYESVISKKSFFDFFSNKKSKENVSYEKSNVLLQNLGESLLSQKTSLEKLLKRPAVSLGLLIENKLVELDIKSFSKAEREDVLDECETLIKYKGYIDRQNKLIERLKNNEDSKIPNGFDFNSCKSLSLEAREKLSFVRPETLGQASRISGVSPSDVAVLSVLVATK
tara:strand:- start:498 stop:2387 length:1890 start_codon:yes stop_codon:yes gene_type:complete